nr:hypothetical protein CTI12_AA095370 [Tanacetum cinerariifolium]
MRRMMMEIPIPPNGNSYGIHGISDASSMGNTNDVSVKKGDTIPKENVALLAFWVPFLLVHLGGPDTITAFALKDNELWLGHLLGLVVQRVAAVYVFAQSLPHNSLWIPTIKRTRSLYLASADRFKDSMLTEPDPEPNYAKIMNEYISKMDGTESESVFFLNRTVKDASKVVEVELKFIDEVLFTKLPVVFDLFVAITRNGKHRISDASSYRLLHTFLIFTVPLRKQTKKIWIITPLWSAYLLADQAAIFAVGLISNSMGNANDVSVKKGDRIAVENVNLLAFWASFLLVHLGGPDTITALALKDNELWL